MTRWTGPHDWSVEVSQAGPDYHPTPIPGDYTNAARYVAAIVRRTPPAERDRLHLVVWWRVFDRVILDGQRVTVDAETASPEDLYIAAALRHALNEEEEHRV